MIILGLDPGNARLGYGVVRKDGPRVVHVAHGCLETPKGMDQGSRLMLLQRQLDAVIAAHTPALVGVEKLFFSKNVKTAMAVSEARGMILLTVRTSGAALAEYTPMEIKVAISGYGGADKKQVQRMVTTLMKLDVTPEPDDAADALAIAYCTAVTHRPALA